MLRACALVGSASIALCAWDSSGAESVRAKPIAPVAPLVPVAPDGAPLASGASGDAAPPLGQFTSCVWSNGGTTYDLSSMTVPSGVNQGAPHAPAAASRDCTPRASANSYSHILSPATRLPPQATR